MKGKRILIAFLPIAVVTAAISAPAFAGGGEPLPFVKFTFEHHPELHFCADTGSVFSAEIEALDESPRYQLSMTVLEQGNPDRDECLDSVGGCRKIVTLPTRFLTPDEVERVTETTTRILLRERNEEPDHDFCPLFDPCTIHIYTLDSLTVTTNVCEGPHLTFQQSAELIAMLDDMQTPPGDSRNGDVNGDGTRDISDPIYLLLSLFAGGPAPVELDCPAEVQCPGAPIVNLDNGDVNGDQNIDIADPTYMLNWLFGGGPGPVPLCRCKDLGCDDCPAPARCVPQSFDTTVCTADLATCEEVEAVYQFITTDYGVRCEGETSCHILFGHCGVGIGGCYYALSERVAQEDLDALASRYTELSCFGPVCDCAPPPDTASCREDGQCRLDV